MGSSPSLTCLLLITRLPDSMLAAYGRYLSSVLLSITVPAETVSVLGDGILGTGTLLSSANNLPIGLIAIFEISALSYDVEARAGF